MTVPLVPADLANLTVLIIDDQQTNIDSLRRVLHVAGFRSVVTHTDPLRALADLHRSRPDLIVLDWHMPGLDGGKVLHELRELVAHDDQIPVVVLTADPALEVRQEALLEGATEFLAKPLPAREVVLRLRNLLRLRAAHRRLRAEHAALEAVAKGRTALEAASAKQRVEALIRVTDVLHARSLSILFQPIVDLLTGDVVGVEALSRFPATPRRDPDKWFAEAASVQLGRALELLAVELALAKLPDLPAGLHCSVNVSAASFCEPALATVIAQAEPHRVIVELTEHSPIEHDDILHGAMDRLRRLGARIAIDDTGTGYAGLQRLLQLQPEVIKLDRSLIVGIERDAARQALVGSQVAFARDVGGTIVAEGIETPEQLDALRRLGVAWGQGYLFARPAELPLARISHCYVPADASRGRATD